MRLIRFIVLLAIMWYMVAMDICRRFMKHKTIYDLACTHHTVLQLVYQTIDRGKQPRALPHFTNGHSSANFSLPLFLRKIHTLFVSIAQPCLFL